MTMPAQVSAGWSRRAAAWLNPRRLRAHAVVLALCLWGGCAIDFATPGFFDRAGNVKFQDFLPLYVSARMIAEHRTGQLYDQEVIAREIRATIAPSNVDARSDLRLPHLYGPQVALLFLPVAQLSFPAAAWGWVVLSTLAYFGCVFLIWIRCPAVKMHPRTSAIAAIAFPPLFHFFVRGQISMLLLACFSAASLAFLSKQDWLAGIALGMLVFKPQFLTAIPIVLLLSLSWRVLGGLLFSASAQLILTRVYFGPAVMRAYLDMLRNVSHWIAAAEPGLSQIQMHSLRSFWALAIPWPQIAFALYLLSSAAAVALAASVWRSRSPLAFRFAALTLAAVLVNPHLFVYDLLVLAPAMLLLIDWILTNTQHSGASRLHVLLYLVFLLPLLGPLTRWTHLQFSVVALAVLLWTLWRLRETAGYRLDPDDSHVV